MSQTLEMLIKAQQQIALTVQQISTLAVQVHQDLAEIEKRVTALEAKAAEEKPPRRGRRGRSAAKGSERCSNSRHDRVPIPRCGLAKQPHRRIPRGIFPIEHPSEIRGKGQQRPGRAAQARR